MEQVTLIVMVVVAAVAADINITLPLQLQKKFKKLQLVNLEAVRFLTQLQLLVVEMEEGQIIMVLMELVVVEREEGKVLRMLDLVEQVQMVEMVEMQEFLPVHYIMEGLVEAVILQMEKMEKHIMEEMEELGY